MDTILITGLTDNGTNIILIPNQTVTTTKLINGGYYCFRLACNMAGLAKNTYPVLIQTTAANLPILDLAGNPVLPNQLRTRKNYKLCYGNQNTTVYGSGQFVMQNKLCCGCKATVSNADEIISTKKAVK